MNQTLCVIYDSQAKRLLLAMKKRGFGKGLWNGPGGKPNPGESLKKTVIRETAEEIGLKITKSKKIADLYFYNPDKDHDIVHVFVYRALTWQGKPIETEEMKPRWFPVNRLPYKKMWPDDPHWLPDVIKNKNIRAHFYFGENQKIIKLKKTLLKSK